MHHGTTPHRRKSIWATAQWVRDRIRPPTGPAPGRHWQRNSTVARASLPGAASVPDVASLWLDATTTADLPRRWQYSSAFLTRRAFSSAPVATRPDDPATSNVPFGPGVTNDLDPHPASATTARQVAQRRDPTRIPLSDMRSPVWTVVRNARRPGRDLHCKLRTVHPIEAASPNPSTSLSSLPLPPAGNRLARIP